MVSPPSVPGGIKSNGCRVLDHVRSWILAFPFSPSQNTPRWQLLAAPQGNSYRWSLWVGEWRLCLGRLGSPCPWPPGDMDSELWSPSPTSKEQLTRCWAPAKPSGSAGSLYLFLNNSSPITLGGDRETEKPIALTYEFTFQ